jgi:uncharacterized protein (DUF2147 family)
MKLFVSVVFLLFNLGIFAQSQAVGVWYNAEKDAKIEIYKCGTKLCGKIIWIKNELDDKGLPRTDTKNPDEKLQKRKILGMTMMQDFEYKGDNVWDNGKIYDPKSGKTYSCKITLKSPKNLDVRGYIGISLVGRTDSWTKAE